jgi:SAM-dependent methyltransferase
MKSIKNKLEKSENLANDHDSLKISRATLLSLDPTLRKRYEYFEKFTAKDLSGIEIGPSYRPTFSKSEGWKTLIIDTLDKEELISKYGSDSHITYEMIQSIENVDLVWDGKFDWTKNLSNSYSWVVACHVIEHQVDLIAFLNQISRAVQEDGFLFLAIPNKNLMFDFFRKESDLTDVLTAYLFPEVHNLRSKLDEVRLTCLLDGRNAWSRDWAKNNLTKQPKVINDENKIKQEVHSIIHNPLENEYVDRHRWVFSPSSFSLIIKQLRDLDLAHWEVVDLIDGEDCEFLAVLRKRS